MKPDRLIEEARDRYRIRSRDWKPYLTEAKEKAIGLNATRENLLEEIENLALRFSTENFPGVSKLLPLNRPVVGGREMQLYARLEINRDSQTLAYSDAKILFYGPEERADKLEMSKSMTVTGEEVNVYQITSEKVPNAIEPSILSMDHVTEYEYRLGAISDTVDWIKELYPEPGHDT